MKRIVQGTNIKSEFECPRDICYSSNHFYVLDQGSCSVDKFAHAGDFSETLYLNQSSEIFMNPWSVRVHEETMAVMEWREKVVLFDWSSKQVKWSIQLPYVLTICFIGSSNQLFMHSEKGDFMGYQLDRNLSPRLIYDKKLTNLRSRSEFMIFTSSQRFILSLGWSKAIAIVDVN